MHPLSSELQVHFKKEKIGGGKIDNCRDASYHFKAIRKYSSNWKFLCKKQLLLIRKVTTDSVIILSGMVVAKMITMMATVIAFLEFQN